MRATQRRQLDQSAGYRHSACSATPLRAASPPLPEPPQECDIELLMTGGFTPLDGFMTRAQYESVLTDMRLSPGGAVFPMPITLDVSDAVSLATPSLPACRLSDACALPASERSPGDARATAEVTPALNAPPRPAPSRPVPGFLLVPRPQFARTVTVGSKIALRDRYSNLVAVATVREQWRPDKLAEAQAVFGTTDTFHPGVDYLFNQAGPVYLSASIEGLSRPHHFDFEQLRMTPQQVRDYAASMGWSRFVAFQTRNPMHRAHIELTKLAGTQTGAGVLIHPVVGMTKPGDVDYHVRVRCYQAVIAGGRHYPKGGAVLALLPLAMRMAGPREALWHAIIRKNHGATHFIVGRDHAGVKRADKTDFYGPYDAQNLVAKYSKEIGIELVRFQMVQYVVAQDRYLPADKVPKGAETRSISGTQFRKMMATGEEIPAWFSDPDVIKILREVSPPLPRRGFTVFFSGLSGSGKSTIAAALAEKLRSVLPTRHLTMLDGDVVRTHLSKELGFSIEDRNTNVARMGWVAAAVTRHGGMAIAATISPFELSRVQSREMVAETGGGFVLVHVSTSLAECVRRDVKGLYAKAVKSGMEVTGLSHPYEHPEQAELTIDAGVVPVEDSVRHIIGWLVWKGYIEPSVVPDLASQATEAALTSAHVLTEGAEDRISSLCRPSAAVAPVFLLGPAADHSQTLRAAASAPVGTAGQRALEHMELGTEQLLNFEAAAGVESASTGATGSAAADSAWESGLPSTSSAPENGARVKVAWDVVVAARGKGRPGSTVLVQGSRLIAYMREIMRIEPCARIVAAAPRDESAVASTATWLAAQADQAAAQAYVRQYVAELRELKRRFGLRVFLADADASLPQEAKKAMASLAR